MWNKLIDFKFMLLKVHKKQIILWICKKNSLVGDRMIDLLKIGIV